MKDLSVLVVDDEYKISEAVAAFLRNRQSTVYTAETGVGALDIFREKKIGFVILDLMLPDLSGEEVCAEIRKVSDVPVIMLTAKAQEEEILRGLELGADDYVTKPFSVRQLYARMEAVLRRAKKQEPTERYSWNGGDLVLDFEKMEAKKGGREIALTPSEWKILSALAHRPQTVFSREKLIEEVFGDDGGYDRTIDTHVKNLRKKIEDDSKNPRYLLTVRGNGYKFGGES